MRTPRHACIVFAALLAACQGHESVVRDHQTDASTAIDLTRANVEAMGLVESEAAVQPLDNAIRIGGHATFDDALVTHIFAPVSGRVIEIRATLGTEVQAGDTLAVLQSPDVAAAVADLRSAEAASEVARLEQDRVRTLYNEAHAASLRDVQQAEAQYTSAQADLQRARDVVQQLRSSAADIGTRRYTIRSPIAGRVFVVNVHPGMEIQGQYAGGTPLELFTIGATEHMWVFADVFEMDSDHAIAGTPVSIEFYGLPTHAPFETTVDWVADMIDPSSRTLRVRMTIPNTDGRVRPEMYAGVTLHSTEPPELAIPRQAVLRLRDQTITFVVTRRGEDGSITVDPRPVQVDEGEGGGLVAVRSGELTAGDHVISDGAEQLLGMM